MNDKTTGLVLGIDDYQENDALVNVLSKDYGPLTLIVKGMRKPTSKNRLFPLNVYEFFIDYKNGKDLYTGRQFRLVKSYFNEEKLTTLSYKNIFLEACLKSRHLENNLYDEVIFVLEHPDFCAGSLFFAALSQSFGIKPYVDGCVICNQQKVVGLSRQKGGFVCLNHAQSKDREEPKYLRKFRLINKGRYTDYDILKTYDYDDYDFRMIVDFFTFNSGMELKSYEFYKTLS